MQFIDKFLSMVKEMLLPRFIHVCNNNYNPRNWKNTFCIQNSHCGKRGFDYYILVFNINYGDYGPIHCQQHNIR